MVWLRPIMVRLVSTAIPPVRRIRTQRDAAVRELADLQSILTRNEAAAGVKAKNATVSSQADPAQAEVEPQNTGTSLPVAQDAPSDPVAVEINLDAWLDERLAHLAAATRPADYDRLLEHAMAILTAAAFNDQPHDRQVVAIRMLAASMVTTGHAQAGVVAVVAARHVNRLLLTATLTLPEACALHDSLWGMWWSSAGSLDDTRPVHSHVCLPFHDFLERRSLLRGAHERARLPPDGRPLRVAYFFHYAHAQRGNAVAPLILSLARAHAALPARQVFAYGVQWADKAWLDASFDGSGVTARVVAQEGHYGRLDELYLQIQADEIDVIVSEITSSITTVLFGRRAAPVQLWIDMGLPYWFQPEVDLSLQAGKRRRDGYPFTVAQSMEIDLYQDYATLFREPSAEALTEAREALPAGRATIAVFTRLIKITPAYLSFLRAVLLRHPQTHFLIVGGGDPRLVCDFMTTPELTGRVTFINDLVDLAAYAKVISIFVDTFPFIGALSCREIAAQGVPIVSLRSHEWDRLQDRDRDPASIAEDLPALNELIDRLLTDPAFHRACADVARQAATASTNVSPGVHHIEAAINRVRQCRRLGPESSP